MISINQIMDNLDDPQKLAQLYHEDPQGFEQLKKQYPRWKFMASMYNPSLIPTLRALGVPVDN